MEQDLKSVKQRVKKLGILKSFSTLFTVPKQQAAYREAKRLGMRILTRELDGTMEVTRIR